MFSYLLIINYALRYHSSCVFSSPNPIFPIRSSRIAFFPFAGGFKNVSPTNGDGVLCNVSGPSEP
jgi:hypothetical protein